VHEHRPRLIACARRITGDANEAEDVVQEVFLRAPRSGALKDPRALPAWLHTVCRRLALDRLRERRRRTRALQRLERPASAEPATGEAERREESERARAALERLEEPYRTALTLRYLEGLPFPEVAARMGALDRTARTWVGRGLCRLRERLKERP
jgi:RNA polymerase sigma-70 factor (ECF subfamily)